MRPIFAIFNFLKGLKTTKFHEVPAGTATKMYGEDSNGDLIKDDVPSGGASAFTELSDVPESYTDQAGKMLIVNENENGLEYTDVPGGSGELPAGVNGQTLRYDINGELEATNQIHLTGDNITATTEYQDGNNYTDAGLSGYSGDIGESSCRLYAHITDNIDTKDSYIDCSVVSESFANFKATIEIVSEQILIKRTNIDDTGKYLRIKNTNGEVEFVDDVLRRVRVELSPAQIRALHTTPIELIPAPNENQLIVISSAIMQYKFGYQDYTGNHEIQLIYGLPDGDGWSAISENFTWQYNGSSKILQKTSFNQYGGLPNSIIGSAINIWSGNAFTNDNALGIITIDVTYRLVTLII